MSDEYGDTAYEPMEDSQTSDYGDSQDGDYAESSDIDDYTPDMDDEGAPQPVPYDRFKESRSQLKGVRGELESSRGRQVELERQVAELSNYSQNAFQQLQRLQAQQQSQQEQDEFSDPMESRLNKLESLYSQHQQALVSAQNQRQEQAVRSAEVEIRGEIEDAREQFRWLDERDILDGLRVNPRANVMELAKRSHKDQERKAYERAQKLGLRPKPRPLRSFGIRGPVKPEDIGEDLEMAEAAAMEFLNSIPER